MATPLLTSQTGLSLAVVVLIAAAAVTYGRQAQRLDSIDAEVRDSRRAVSELSEEVRSLRGLILLQQAKTTTQPTERIP